MEVLTGSLITVSYTEMFTVCRFMIEDKLINIFFSFFIFLAGKYGSEIRPAFWLNFVFLLVPVWGAVTLFRRPKDRPLIGGYNVSPTHKLVDLEYVKLLH